MFGIDIALALLGARKWLSRAFSAVARFIKDNPWRALAIFSLLAFVWAWRGWGGEEEDHAVTRQAHKAKLEQIEAASQRNLAAALDQVKAVEAKSAELAKDADHAHELALQDARAATAAYISRSRVRPGQGGSCPAPASAEGNDPGLPAEVPSDPLVAIREPDLQALVEWATVGVEAHNHAVGKINAGLAKVPEGWPDPALSSQP
jgi:hypothetical protein